ncbi:MAG: glycosyltransferase [Gallionellaceae bacterium]
MSGLSFALCTYNRSERLPKLIAEMRAQICPIPFEVLIVDNNSSDDTREVVPRIAETPGTPVRYIFEPEQGIPYARNRAITEAMDKDILVFMDDDELPRPGLLAAAVHALTKEGARCAGGKVKVTFPPGARPKWLVDDLLPFLAEVDYGDEPFWIRDRSTPIWTANIAYDMNLFRDNSDLRFDPRYNRLGHTIGGGSDGVLLGNLLERAEPIRYRPDMVVDHYVDTWRLRRRYFLKLHFIAGRKYGQFQMGDYPRTVFGVPPFMITLAFTQWARTAAMVARRESGVLRQAMNGTHALGAIWGRVRRRFADNGQRST